MAQSIYHGLGIEHLTAHITVRAFRQAAGRTTGGNRPVDHGGVTQRVNDNRRPGQLRVTHGAVHHVVVGACVGTVAGHRVFNHRLAGGVAQSIYHGLGIEHLTAHIAVRAFRQAAGRTTGSDRPVDHGSMAGSHFVCNIAVAAGLAGVGRISALRTGRTRHNTCCVAMCTDPNPIHIIERCGISGGCKCAGFKIASIGVLQLDRGDGDLYIAGALNQLICQRLGSILYGSAHAFHTGNSCAGCCCVDVAVACERAAHPDRCIPLILQFDAAGACSAGCILHGNDDLIGGTAIVAPLVGIIEIQVDSRGQHAIGTIFHRNLSPGEQCYVLVNGNGAVLLHRYADVAVDGQIIILGVNAGGTYGQIDRGHGQIAVGRHCQSVSSLIVILGYRATGQTEHGAVCAVVAPINKCHGRIKLRAGHRNCSGGVFLGSMVERHRDFNVLHVVLGYGEYVIFHIGGLRTAPEIHDLEILINYAAAHYLNTAGTGDIAVAVQGAAVVYGNLASLFHLGKPGRTVR